MQKENFSSVHEIRKMETRCIETQNIFQPSVGVGVAGGRLISRSGREERAQSWL